ncbi:hypothetical protein PPERSA_02656 [Pseudocohnilembus persalinus]|uniref:Uncharacterized protein n=1 Tax=Pseudocohnilembus persalinus TaxID=266149 RepID=A0A0V0R6J9_PSEPJ|nr:hypothetical protein PPERSA_02656 [Pseudocohnilembus persalinus]|eukprot:KRX09784.1 hypothetical protein PPERSA_02656 [Pseudocohnilembus persalinus]
MQKQNIQLQLNDLFQLKEQIEEKLEEKVLFKNFHLELEPIVSEFIQILDNLDKESKNMINNLIINTTFDIKQYESHFSEEEKENEQVIGHINTWLNQNENFLEILKKLLQQQQQ